MIIPKLHYLSEGNSPKEHLENIQKACTSGIELVQLCLKDVSEKRVLKLAKEVIEITSRFQTRLIINGHNKVAKEIKADGVHLEKTDGCPTIVKKHLYTWQIIGCTANTLQDCETLIEKGANYINLGPFKSNNIIDSVIGLNGYTAIMEALKTEIPVLGFGNISTKDVTAIVETGISGIAVSEDITKDFNNIKIFKQLLNTDSATEQRYTFK